MIEVTVNGIKELLRDTRAMPKKVETAVIGGMAQIAFDATQKGAGSHFKPSITSGALWQSVYNRPIKGGREVGHDPQRAPHARFVLFGTRPHIIKPKKRKALRWVGPGGYVFAKKVKHPGYRGDDYLLRARDDAVDQYPKLFDAALKRAL